MAMVKNELMEEFDKTLDCIKTAYNGNAKEYFADWCRELAEKKKELAEEIELFKLIRKMYNDN